MEQHRGLAARLPDGLHGHVRYRKDCARGAGDGRSSPRYFRAVGLLDLLGLLAPRMGGLFGVSAVIPAKAGIRVAARGVFGVGRNDTGYEMDSRLRGNDHGVRSCMNKSAHRERVTEQDNPASASLDRKSTRHILRIINREDRTVAAAVAKVIPEVARAVDLAVEALSAGGRMIYLGAGTSGRLGVLDAAECGPTFGTNQVRAVMAGAPEAMFRPAEVSEDDAAQAQRDLRRVKLNRDDVLVGISASGRTPYTLS